MEKIRFNLSFLFTLNLVVLGFLIVFSLVLPESLKAQVEKALVPNLLVDKKVEIFNALPGDTLVEPGDTLVYTIQYKNALTDTAYNVKLLDYLPEKTIFNAGLNSGINPGLWALNDDTLTYPLGILAPSQAGSVFLYLIVGSEDNFTLGQHNILNVVEIRGRDENNLLYNNKNAALATLSLMSDVSVQKSHQPDEYDIAFKRLTYTILLKNFGNKSAENVTVADTLTYLLSAVFSTPGFTGKTPFITGTTIPDTIITWNIPVIAPGDSIAIVLTTTLVDVTVPGYDLYGMDKLVNRAGVSLNYEQNKRNNYSEDITKFKLIPGPGFVVRDLQIQKTDGKTVANAGDILTYEIEYWNWGNLWTNNILITDNFPEYTQFISASFVKGNDLHQQNLIPNSSDPKGIEWHLNTLSPHAKGKIILKLKILNEIPLGQINLINTVSIVTTGNLLEWKDDNNVAKDITTVSSFRDLRIKKVAEPDTLLPGEKISFRLYFKNLGNLPADNVIIVDSLGNLAYFDTTSFKISHGGQFANGKIIWTIGIIPPNNTDSLITIEVNTKTISDLVKQEIRNFVRIVTPDPEDDYFNNADSTLSVIFFEPLLKLEKHHDLLGQSEVGEADTFKYVISYRNIGTADAKAVTLLDTLPDFIQIIGADSIVASNLITWEKISDSPLVIKFNLGDLPAKSPNWSTIEIFVKTDASLPGGNQLLVNHGVIIDSTGSYFAFMEDKLIVSGPLFLSEITIVPSENQILPDGGLYIGSFFELVLVITKPIANGTIIVDFRTTTISLDLFNDFIQVGADTFKIKSALRVPDNAEIGPMTATAFLTSIHGEQHASTDNINIFKAPEKFDLDHNSVELMNGETVQVSFSLSKPERAEIKIYTVAGELVKKLYDDEYETAGKDMQIPWDGANDKGQLVASGVYLVHLKTPSFEIVKKVIIVR